MPRLLLLVLLVLCGCSRPKEVTQTQWTTNNVTGLTMTLVDPTRYELFGFSGNGYVAVSFGTKDAITSPLYRWKLSDNRLQIYDEYDEDETNKIYADFTLVSLDSSSVVVRRHTGEVAHYKVLRKCD
jgi:hypothetical protein